MPTTDKLNQSSFSHKIMQKFEKTDDTKIIKKGDCLIREGEIEKQVYFITSGAVKLFYLSELGERIIRFGYEGSIINSLSSFLTNEPSEFYIEAIRKTEVKIIRKEEIENLIYESEESLKEYSKFLEELLAQQMAREIDLLTSSPNKRLERVLERSPDLFQHVPLKYIAAYLRMNPETLSRIRKS
ncbi:MAG: Crp/Fnr family transcriptional regulator [Flavobacteriales bacterium]|nr:Crp/Fnr family transcriptional regulator [Flavobacteriales bacterium]